MVNIINMRKILKKWGGNVGILFNNEDIKIYDLKEGDVIDIKIEKVKKK